jgi:2'-5' RNA ligase
MMEVMSASSVEAGQSLNEPGCSTSINCFALVAYIPGSLGNFLDGLRLELEPDSHYPRAHVTVLPPRPLPQHAVPADACRAIEQLMPCSQPIEIVLGRIEIFPVTNVVYLTVEDGFPGLVEMHSRLDAGPLAFREAFIYHPHVTLAQGVSEETSIKVAQEASRRLSEYTGPRGFRADALTFVQNTLQNRWVDLAEYNLAPIRTV